VDLIATPSAQAQADETGGNAGFGDGENAPLAKIQKPVESTTKDFSPMEFSPMPDKHFSPMRKREFSPMTSRAKKPKLAPVKQAKNGRRGRPRNPELPPAPDKYYYWSRAGNGLKVEKRKPSYEYVDFIMPAEWAHLRGKYDEDYILQTIIAAIRIKRARSTQGRRNRASHTG
jgi:hypothetical protein